MVYFSHRYSHGLCGGKSFVHVRILMRIHNHPKLNYHKIVDYIYVGTNLCCQTHFDERLLKKKIRADLSLERIRLDAPFGVDYYLWLPVPDRGAPTEAQFELGVAMIRFCVARKIHLYAHCARGHGRAPTLVAAYLISTGMPLRKAVALVKQRRPVTHLNRAQYQGLRRFEQLALAENAKRSYF